MELMPYTYDELISLDFEQVYRIFNRAKAKQDAQIDTLNKQNNNGRKT